MLLKNDRHRPPHPSVCGFFLGLWCSAAGISNYWPVARMVEVEQKNRERLKQKHDEERDEAQLSNAKQERGKIASGN